MKTIDNHWAEGESLQMLVFQVQYHSENKIISSSLPIFFRLIYRGLILGSLMQDLDDGKASAHQDLLSVLLTTPYENGSFMTEEEIKDNIILMLFGGHDTSSSTLAHVLKYLFLNPQCWKEVIQGAPINYLEHLLTLFVIFVN